jgi:hypothetical protein
MSRDLNLNTMCFVQKNETLSLCKPNSSPLTPTPKPIPSRQGLSHTVHQYLCNTSFTYKLLHNNVECGICALLGYYAASSGNTLPTFRDKLLVPSSSVSWTSRPLKMGPICRPETSIKDYYSTLRNIPEERRSHQHRGVSLKSRMLSVFV